MDVGVPCPRPPRPTSRTSRTTTCGSSRSRRRPRSISRRIRPSRSSSFVSSASSSRGAPLQSGRSRRRRGVAATSSIGLPRKVVIGATQRSLFHALRRAGNEAVHEGTGGHREALHQLKMCRELGICSQRAYGKTTAGSIPGRSFHPPEPRNPEAALHAELYACATLRASARKRSKRQNAKPTKARGRRERSRATTHGGAASGEGGRGGRNLGDVRGGANRRHRSRGRAARCDEGGARRAKIESSPSASRRSKPRRQAGPRRRTRSARRTRVFRERGDATLTKRPRVGSSTSSSATPGGRSTSEFHDLREVASAPKLASRSRSPSGRRRADRRGLRPFPRPPAGVVVEAKKASKDVVASD